MNACSSGVRLMEAKAPVRLLDRPAEMAPARAAEERVVHLLDMENLCNAADVRGIDAALAMRRYIAAVSAAVDDHIIAAASHHNALASGLAWRSARLLPPRSGVNGADEALREVIATEDLAGRFTTIYLGSGDGIFTQDLSTLAAAGMRTHVVSRTRNLSRALRLSAHDVTLLDHPLSTKDAVA